MASHSVTLYNTLHRKKMTFVPMDSAGKKVGLYACGPTVYHYAHIGNLRTYVFEDFLRRVLEYNGYDVNHIVNITDVGHLTDDADQGEDKMERSALEQGKTVWEIAEAYTKAFQQDIRKLNIIDPKVWCKATDHITEQISWIEKLEKEGFTYTIADGVYFDTAKLEDYGKLVQLDLENLKAGARVEFSSDKRNVSDFALWKFSPKDKKRQMEWDSPWGTGFPGWHIECSAMSMRYLGDEFDIHCGGVDHAPVHHTNEIAQVEAITKKQWVKFWLHGEFLIISKDEESETQKMSKSKGNVLTLEVLEESGFEPLAYRYFLMNTHYRKQLIFNETALKSAQQGYRNLLQKIHKIQNEKSQVEQQEELFQKHQAQFKKAVNDDLNVTKGLAILWEVVQDKNLSPTTILALIENFDQVLGLNLLETAAQQQNQDIEVPEHLQELLETRNTARANKDWAKADEMRNKIAQAGYKILDSKDGSKLEKI